MVPSLIIFQYNSYSAKMQDRLVRINPEDLELLKNLYEGCDVQSYVSYMTIKNHIQWIEVNQKSKEVNFFALNGDFTDGTFIVIVSITIINY